MTLIRRFYWFLTNRCKECGRDLDMNLKCKTHDYPAACPKFWTAPVDDFNPDKTLLWIARA